MTNGPRVRRATLFIDVFISFWEVCIYGYRPTMTSSHLNISGMRQDLVSKGCTLFTRSALKGFEDVSTS